MKKIEVKTASLSGTIYLGEDVIAARLPYLLEGQQNFILTDENVYTLHRAFFEYWMQGEEIFVLPSGEEYKSFASLQAVLEKMVAAGLKRTSRLFAVGGGVIGDLGGLCASLYMRGISCVQIPTTLLSMVDSSVGGKTAIDVLGVKNVVGAFYQPCEVLIDPMFLGTLPDREWKCGVGEIVKYAALDKVTFDEIEKNGGVVSRALAYALIENSVRFKAAVVSRDEKESGERKCLNIGHTTGHVVEPTYGLSHGESVLWGMKFETLLAMNSGVCEREYGEKLLSFVDGALAMHPTCKPDFSTIAKAAAVASQDKKNVDGKNVVMTVPKAYGQSTLLSMPTGEYASSLQLLAKNF